MSTVGATPKVQEIRNRIAEIQQRNAKKTAAEAAKKSTQPKPTATPRVQEIRNRITEIQQRNAEKTAAEAAEKSAQPKPTATPRVQEIRNRIAEIQRRNAERSQANDNVMQTGKSTARTSNTDTVSISTRSNSSSYIGQYKYMSDESLDKTINNLKNTIKNSKSGTATYYAQKALEGYEAEKSKRSLSTMLTGSHSENLESYLRGLEKQYGTQYVCDKVFGGDKSKYDPVKRAEQICGINGSRVSDTAMKNRVDEVVNGKNIKICKNNTSLYRKNQVNGNQYNYSFSKDFNAELEKSVNDLVDDVIDGRFSEQEKMYLKKVVPYIVKGIGASESSWSSSKGGFVGLTSDGLNGVDYFNYTFKHNNFSNDLKEYVTPKSGAELSAAMIIHWASYYKQNNTNIENALWLGQVSYCGGESNAAYQLGMANDFYVQDTGDLLFSGVCKSVVLNLEQYGVYSDKNASQLEDVTIYPDRCIRSRCVE